MQLGVAAPKAQSERKHHPHADRGGRQQQYRQHDAHPGVFRSRPGRQYRSEQRRHGERRQQRDNSGDHRARLGRTGADRGAADSAKEKNREKHDAQPVNWMSEEDHAIEGRRRAAHRP